MAPVGLGGAPAGDLPARTCQDTAQITVTPGQALALAATILGSIALWAAHPAAAATVAHHTLAALFLGVAVF